VGSYRNKRITPLTNLDKTLEVQGAKALFRPQSGESFVADCVAVCCLVRESNHSYLLTFVFRCMLELWFVFSRWLDPSKGVVAW